MTERLVPIANVPNRIPSSRPGVGNVHISTVYRWASVGVQGVKLETVKVGGCRYTSAEALERFLAALNAEEVPTTETSAPQPGERQRAIRAAERKLTQLGV